MKVFMLGWEFPPFISGGLGTACHGLTKAMSKIGLEVVFVLPTPIESAFSTHVIMLTPQQSWAADDFRVEYDELKNVKFHEIESLLQPYSRPEGYQKRFEEIIKQKRLIDSDNIEMSVGGFDITAAICLPRLTATPPLRSGWR